MRLLILFLAVTVQYPTPLQLQGAAQRQEINELKAEVLRLRDENATLRARLGLPAPAPVPPAPPTPARRERLRQLRQSTRPA
jgi:cell division protein FtsB